MDLMSLSLSFVDHGQSQDQGQGQGEGQGGKKAQNAERVAIFPWVGCVTDA